MSPLPPQPEDLLADLPPEERDAARPVLRLLAEQARAASPDEVARARVRERVQRAIALRIDAPPAIPSRVPMKTIFSGVLGFAAALLVVGGYLAVEHSNPRPASTSGTMIARLPDRAFDGALNAAMVSNTASTDAAPTDAARESAPTAAKLSQPTGSSKPSAPASGLSAAPTSQLVPAQPPLAPPVPVDENGASTPGFAPPGPYYLPPEYVYTFTGTALADVPSTLDVIRMDPGTRVAPVVSQDLLRSLGIGGTADSAVQRVSVRTAGGDPYVFDYDFQGGTWNAYRDWQAWKGPPDAPMPLGIRDTPEARAPELSDAEAISIARDFLREHAIDISGLDAPRVDDAWRRYQYQTPAMPFDGAMGQTFPVMNPPSVTVLFGKSFGGRPLLAWDGAPDGWLRVTVNAADKRVEQANGWLPAAFRASAYPSVAVSDALIQARAGGINQPWGGTPQPDLPPGKKRPRVTVTLTEMKLGYTQRMLAAGTYLIPVYVFTGTQVENGQQSPASVIVSAVAGDFFRAEQGMVEAVKNVAAPVAPQPTPAPVGKTRSY